jgi:alpha-amylase
MLQKKAFTVIAGFCLLVLSFGLSPLQAQDDKPAQTGTDGLPWWNDRTFYEIFVRSFQDSNGDGIGDLQGVISKLDYLNDGDSNTATDLGVTGIWLMPIFESPSYHGYDVTDYMKIEPDYGTNDDFKQLIAEAHKRGIAVIIDMVINHTSSEHPWFIDSQTAGSEHDQWYRWSDTKPVQLGPWNQQVWYPLGSRFYYAVFWQGMPDLNLTNPAVTDATHNIAKYWLDDMGVDGFRMDGARYYVEDKDKLADSDSNLAWLKDWKGYVDSVNPNALMVGEVWTTSFVITKYVPASLDLAFEFDLATSMLNSAKSGTNGAVSPIETRSQKLYPPSQYARFLTNHDQNRAMNELSGDVNKAKIAASMLLTGAGVPFIYYGEEIGMMGAKPDECLRTPMQWDATDRTEDFMTGKNCKTNETIFNVSAEVSDATSLLTQYRSLIHLRNDHAALRVGSFTALKSSDNKVYSFVRHSADETVLVVINLSDAVVSDYKLNVAKTTLTGELKASVLFGDGTATAPTLGDAGAIKDYTPLATLAPYSTTIIQLQAAS